jgi:hypothetical protein
MVLPCKHEERITRQVKPTIDLLTNMDVLHPDVLLQHAIQPGDYKGGLVFRSAIESIRGTFIASSTTGREGLVKDVLDNSIICWIATALLITLRAVEERGMILQ